MTTTPTRAELLAFRKKVVAASLARRPRAVPQQPPPSAIVLEYTKALLQLSDAMDAAIYRVLEDDAGVRMDAAEGDVPQRSRTELDRLAAKMQRTVEKSASFAQLRRKLDQIAQRSTKFTRDQFRKQLKSALGVDLAADPDLSKQIDRFRDENVTLIKSLAADKVTRVRSVLEDAGADTRVEVIAKRIREQTGATRSRAALIARDQVLSLNAQMTEARHVSAGIVEYEWNTSQDERVREGHKDLHGTRQRYDKPPIVDARTGRKANPGQDFQCRCIALPVLPEE